MAHLPVVPPFGVDNAPVLERHQELPRLILDVHQAVGEAPDLLQERNLLRVDVRGRHACLNAIARRFVRCIAPCPGRYLRRPCLRSELALIMDGSGPGISPDRFLRSWRSAAGILTPHIVRECVLPPQMLINPDSSGHSLGLRLLHIWSPNSMYLHCEWVEYLDRPGYLRVSAGR